MTLPQRWNLDPIYSNNDFLQKELDKTAQSLEKLKQALIDQKKPLSIIELSQEIDKTLHTLRSFIECLGAQNVTDVEVPFFQDQLHLLEALFTTLSNRLDQMLAEMDEQTFNVLLKQMSHLTFPLTERRKSFKDKLSLKEEALINDLGIDGFCGWEQMWGALLGDLSFELDNQKLSFGQIENKLTNTDRNVRKQAFEIITKKFKRVEPLFAPVLNHLGGFRLQVAQKRDWDSILKEPLFLNRMEEQTLDAMWKTIDQNKAPLIKYMQRKADLLKIPKLSWYDLESPLYPSEQTISYDYAAQFIIGSFEKFSPKMAAFAKKALKNNWVDAEDLPNKGPGGFCVDLPNAKTSRIFMTYSNTTNNLFTLAHELGHAFHNEATYHLEEMARHFSMSVAETASTMAEMIVSKAAIAKAEKPKDKLLLLDDHLSRSISYLLNIHARFLFEKSFYSERKKGFVSVNRLNLLMEEAQKTAYQSSLETYHPTFWLGKMHFYFADLSFYNFPYTFGYLFSLGIFSSLKNDKNFEDKYLHILEDTGQMSVEQLAQKHLKADLTKENFWKMGLNEIAQDVQTFLDLSNEI